MTSKSQRNENGEQEKEQEIRKDAAKKQSFGEEGEGSDTSQLDKKIIGVETGLSALNRRLVVENNFISLESVALEGLDEVKINLVELEEVNKEGLTNLELKLTETLSSFHREFETLKRQVDDTASARVAGLVTVCETCIEAPKPKEFLGERNAQDVENFLWQMDAYFKHVNITSEVDNNQNKGKPVPNRGSDARGNNRNQLSNFHKNYKDRKKGVPHREGYYICGETTHAALYCPLLSKLNAIVAAQKQQEQAAM
ncbi:hypothetical protein H5410_005809 [Solanum commersonii]|uniref:Uncharacterized protein n=1 Tax=Solanum commersonii TaxID=4109 RepID=A0A9J6A9E3_SOLCO|nr:hypothetical protein H5410_005809 [Solanum commersonii]